MRIKKTSQYIQGGAGLPSYFTDEIDTGMKWIDGKPIYRKVYDLSTFNASPHEIDTSSLNVAYPISIKTIWNKGNLQTADFDNYYNSDTDKLRCYYRKTSSSDVIRIVYATSSSITKFTVIFEYTKTTD